MANSAEPHPTPVLWPMQWSLPKGVHALCTTRAGGYSAAPYASFNLGDHVLDAPDAVAANRALLQTLLAGARPVFLSQVHGVQLVALDAHTPDGTTADACITQVSQLACTIMVADCLPLLFTDDAGKVVAAAHAGWRGLAGGVIEQTVLAVCRQADVSAAQIRVWLGPCIGPQAFEVGADVLQGFGVAADQTHPAFKAMGLREGQARWLADLPALARQRLQRLGLGQVWGNDGSPAWCTASGPARFFSHRRDALRLGSSGRMAACIWRD